MGTTDTRDMNSPRPKRDESRETVFGAGTSFEGHLRFRDPLRIQGRFSGTIEATGALTVDKGATVEVDRVAVSSVVVAGTLIGNIEAVDRVDMLTGAKVHGDVSTSRLRIADGVLFEGACEMINVDGDIDIFSGSVDELKTALQAVPLETIVGDS